MALHYKIALTGVWWNDEYKDVRRFSSYSDRASYFNLSTIFNGSPVINFDIKNLINPRIVFKAPNRNVFDVLNSNYLIVNNTSVETESLSNPVKYYFYFIDKIVQDCGDQYIADCKLDAWTTTGLIASIGEGFVERAHLDRFTDDESDLGLNFAADSPLMIEEKTPSDNDKILIDRKKLTIPYHNQAQTKRFGDWFTENIKAWIYVFIQGDKSYTGLKFGATSILDVGDSGLVDSYLFSANVDKIFMPYSILAIPVYKNSKVIYFQDYVDSSKKIKILSNFSLFRYYNNGYSFVYSQKILPVNPLYSIFKKSDELDFETASTLAEIDANGDLIIKTNAVINENLGYTVATSPDAYILCGGTKSGNIYQGNLAFGSAANNIQTLLKQYLTIADTDLDKPYITNHFLASNLKAYIKALYTNHAKRIQRLNPKLYGASYHEFRLNVANQGAASFSYAQLAAYKNQEQNLFIARASLVPEVETLGLSPYKSFYLTDSKDYLSAFGTIISSDFSIAFKNDVYEQFLANNKNFWLQNKVNWQKKAFDLFTGSLLSGDYSTKGAGKLLRGGVDISIDMFSTKYQVNNMQNAPDNYSAGSGSVSYQMSFEDGVAYYLDEYKAPECIIKRDDDYMHLYGFKVGRLMNFTEVYNIRAYFNFVQGNFDAITGIKSNEVRRILKDSLLSGVRFWNVDRSSSILERENFENRLVSD